MSDQPKKKEDSIENKPLKSISIKSVENPVAISLKDFSEKEKELLLKKGKKFIVEESGKKIEISVVAAYNGAVIGPTP